MSKKKSYMDISNILKEDVISAFFRGLFMGKRSKADIDKELKSNEKKFRKDIKKNVDNINKNFTMTTNAINKWRVKNGKKPKKAPKITVDDVVKQAKDGKY